MTSVECHKLHEFVDGELPAREAEHFRTHLSSCEKCAADMPQLLEVIAACAESSVAPAILDAVATPASTKRPWSRSARYVAAVGVAAAVAAVLIVAWRRERPAALALLFTSASARAVEVRLSYPGAAAHRPYQVSRGEAGREDLPFEKMAKLERAGDWHGLAIASLLRGDRAGATRYLERAHRSGAVDTDRAAVDILDGSDAALEQGLTLLDQVLAATPDNTAARWNRGLALARLDLPLAAASDFERVVAAGEPGWSTEAAYRARALRAGVEPRRSAWNTMYQMGRSWTEGEGPIVHPPSAPSGSLRLFFYDAVRAADSRARVMALVPLARELDTLFGGDALVRYANTVAAEDFHVRAPLAAAFRGVALGNATLDAEATEKLSARMRAAGMMDLWMGVVSQTGTIGGHAEVYRTAADASGDPWFAVLGAHEQAKREIADGDLLRGERRLLEAAESAAHNRLEYRRLLIEQSLSELYLTLRRYPEAERRGRRVLVDARAAGEWAIEQSAINGLAETSRFRYSSALSRAYLAEALERDTDGCAARRYVHQSLANLAMLGLDPVAARREMAAAPLCDEPIQLLAAMTWADLYRFGGTETDARWLREKLAALRAGSTLDAGQLALADHIEGRLLIEVDRPSGQALLRKAIAEVSGHRDDASTKTRASSFSILALDAGRAGEYDAVLAVLAEELGGSAPGQCVVGVAVEDERAIVAVRGLDGSIEGKYTPGRSSPIIEAASLIPPALVGRLDGCTEVAVLARPPLLGMAKLLPPTIAWSYRLSGSAPRRVPAAPGQRLIVADANPPAYLELPALRPFDGGASGAVVLRGGAATPDHVLAAIRDASVIEFHTHGFVDRGLSDASYLALTSDREGRYALTAAEVEASELRGAPIVILAACHAAAGAPFLDEGYGLPLAFVHAGARAVLASPAAVDDTEAGAFFEAVRAEIETGVSAAVAVRDERMRRAGRPSSKWSSDVIVYQ